MRTLGSMLVGLALGTAALLAGGAEAEPVRWEKSRGGNGHLYEAVAVGQRVNWVGAFIGARRRGCGWYLATITSAAENAFVTGLFAGRPELLIGADGPWIGGFQRNSTQEPAGQWRWVTDERWSYAAWNGPAEPTNRTYFGPELHPGVDAGQQEDFLGMLSNGKWNDLPANALLKGYVVEHDDKAKRACFP